MNPDTVQQAASDTLQAVHSLTREVNIGWLVFKMIFMLLLVIGAIFAVSWMFKKFTRITSLNKQAKWVTVISRVQVAPQNTILLVKIFGKVIAVMETPNHLTVLSEWQEDEIDYMPDEQESLPTAKFMDLLKKSIGTGTPVR